MLREIVLDTETTGFDPLQGHRVVEVACLELVNHIPTGRSFRRYMNPERDMPQEAADVHGLTAEFLADKPRFAEIVEELLDFIGEATLVAHNAEFDWRFLNAELTRCGRAALPRARMVDTLAIARQRFPGAQASLDALCRRFGVDNTARTFHGALLDCELLAEVYLELRGGRQPELLGGTAVAVAAAAATLLAPAGGGGVRPPRPHAPSPEELAAHAAMLQRLKSPLWLQET